ILLENDALHLGAGIIVDRVGDVLVFAVFAAPAGHRHERPRLALNDLEAPDDKAVVQRDAGEGLEFCVLSKRHSYFSDLHRSPFPSGTSGAEVGSGPLTGFRWPVSLASQQR